MVRVRMVRAAELLRHPDQLPLGEVAQRRLSVGGLLCQGIQAVERDGAGRFRQQGWPALPG